jgi:uncharacterized protein YdeI (YjbR/CyaY-like superfamily)
VNPDVDIYIQRSDQWPAEMTELRPILLGCGLDESVKWAKPCYSHRGKNVAIMQEMKEHLSLMFFKGALLSDPEGVLREQGPNSRSARRMEFRSVEDVARLAPAVQAYVDEAIAAEEAGLTVDAPPDLELVAELQARLDSDPELAAAFSALTPGRQREYHLHISDAKQASTREARIDKVAPRILEGKGLRDR